MPGINEFTKLMLHMNGSDGSTSFTDDSDSGHTVTANGDAQVDTDQSVFGGASALFDGVGDWLSIPDSDEFHLDGDFTIDFRARFNSSVPESAFFGQSEGGGSPPKYGLYWSTSTFGSNKVVFHTNVGNISFDGWSPVADTWYHLALVRSGNDWFFFVDGTQIDSTQSSSISLQNSSSDFRVGADGENFRDFNGWIDEFRVQNGEAVWTSNFTPPTEEYSVGEFQFTVNETINFNESNNITPSKINFLVNEDISFNEVNSLELSRLDFIVSEILSFSEQNNLKIALSADFITGIYSFNPLIVVSDTDPAEIVKVDITDPTNPLFTKEQLTGAKNAKDVYVDTVLNFAYVACADGLVIKVDIDDLTNQITIDLSDTDELLTIDGNSNYGLVYTTTDNDVGELYLIDERSTFSIDSDFNLLSPLQVQMDSSFNIITNFSIDSDFNLLAQNTFTIDTDFKCLTNTIDDIDPIGLPDYQVFIDSTELEDTDLILDSITINHTVGEESRASFRLARKHDQLNTTLNGNTVTITNQNSVEIKIDGQTEFNGNISRVRGTYNNLEEYVDLECLSEEKTNKFNNITMSLPGLNSRLSLYNVLMQTPNIYNPVVDATNEDNPKKFKGIRVPFGNHITQNVSRFTVFDSFGSVAEAIQDGTFNPLQNWTYFWSPTIRNLNNTELGSTSAISFNYIGTSLSPVSDGLWELTNAKHRRQRIFDDDIVKLGDGTLSISDIDDAVDNASSVISELKSKGFLDGSNNITNSFKQTTEPGELNLSSVSGNDVGEIYRIMESKLGYEVGEAPFQTVGLPRTGKFTAKFKWADLADGLYSIKDASFDYTDFAKQVADLEYEALKNINGDILPETSCSLTMTIDAYLFYSISLLTRIGIDNTTEPNIYKNQNGFPVSVKSITITSADRKVNIEADNLKSTNELETLNGLFPDEDSEEFNEEEQRILISTKSDVNTGNTVE